MRTDRHNRAARSWLRLVPALAMLLALGNGARAHEVKDLKYGAVLFEFYQQKYFETLVEYEYATVRGGIREHGNYPELLKGGVSLSYGLDIQAQQIFSALIAEHMPEEIQNRAWFYLAKMLYLRGDTGTSATTLANIHGALPADIDQEYRYLAALINIRLGYFDAAETISRGFDRRSVYAPYLHFNLGVAQGKQQHYEAAFANLEKAAAFADDSAQLARLADRAHMASAYLQAERENFANAYRHIRLVSASGVYSNRALLGSSWASINSGAYREALVPLDVLQKRSLAIPEVQEAVLLAPHVYEKLGLPGRAAQGFITAYDRYGETLAQLEQASASLRDTDVLELFVRNLDEMLGESDWFGTAPSVSLNALSPFLLELMADHSFQSVLKDLRDLYAIRNNLQGWKRKQDDFEVIVAARGAVLNEAVRKQGISGLAARQQELQQMHEALARRANNLGERDRERVQWLLAGIGQDIGHANATVQQLREAHAVSTDVRDYARQVRAQLAELDTALAQTNRLIASVESVMLELVNAELDMHRERLRYYQVQSQLAKVRILDRSLANIDERAPATEPVEDRGQSSDAPVEGDHQAGRGAGDEVVPEVAGDAA